MHIFYIASIKQLYKRQYTASSTSVTVLRLSQSPAFSDVMYPDQGVGGPAATGWPQHRLAHRHH